MSRDIREQLNQMPATERLAHVRAVQEALVNEIKEKIAMLQRERCEMNAQYEEEIGGLSIELSNLGLRHENSRPSDVGSKAFNFLREKAGERIQAGALMKAIRHEGAVASIVLAPYIETGRVKFEFESRARRYWVEPDNREE
jgi:hypothetical protein